MAALALFHQDRRANLAIPALVAKFPLLHDLPSVVTFLGALHAIVPDDPFWHPCTFLDDAPVAATVAGI